MKSPRSNVRAIHGFTLMELLLGIAVGAVILIVIQTTFFGALRLHNTTHRRIDADLVVQRALGIIRRDLAGLMLPGGTMVGQLQTSSFTSSMTQTAGERVSPDFFTNSGRIDGWTPFSELQQVAYYLAPSPEANDVKDLVRVVTRNLISVQEPAPDEQVVLHGVAAVTVMFYDGIAWTDTWDSETSSTLPRAIKFSLTMASENAQVSLDPIELDVPVLVTTTTSAAEAQESAL